MPNEKLVLQADLIVTGQTAADALSASLQRVVDIATKSKATIAEPSKTGFEAFPAKLKEFVENPIQSAQSTIAEFSKSFGAMGIAAAGTIGVLTAIAAASYEASKSLGELGVQTQNISIKTGLSTREVGLFSFAAKAAGSDIGVFETAMRKLSQGLADGGEEGKKANDALSALGIKTRELNGDIRPTSEIFGQVGEAMDHMSSAAERNTLAVKLFGRSGIELVPVLMHLKENLQDAANIGLGITDSEQTKFLDLYKKKIEEVDGAWSVAKRHFEEGIAGTFTLQVSGTMAKFFDALVSGHPGSAVDTKSLFGVNLDPWTISQGTAPASVSTDTSGDAIAKHFQNSRLNTKEGIEARIADLEKKNNESGSLLNGSGIGATIAHQAVASIDANQKIIDRLRDQLKSMEESTAELHANAKKLDDLRKEGHSFITFGSGKNQTVITDDEIMKASMADAAEKRRINPPTLDGPGQWGSNWRNDRVFDVDGNLLQDRIGGNQSFDRSNSDLDSLRTYGLQRSTKMQIEAGSDWLKDSSHRDDLTMRGINDTSERQARLAGIGARPEDALAVAAKQRDIRLQAIADDKATLLLSQGRYDITDKMYALEQRAQDAQIEYNEKVQAQLAKQQEQFRSISGSLYDSFFGGGKGVSSFFKSQAEGIGKTIFENVAQFGQKAIMGDGTAAHPGIIPHAAANTTLGKIFGGTPFGPNPMTSAGTTLTTAGTNLIQAAADLTAVARGGGSAGGGYPSIGGNPLAGMIPSLPAAFGTTPDDWPALGANPLAGMIPNLPAAMSSRPMIGSTTGDLMAGAAAIGGTISAIKAFGGSGSGGVQGKLDGVGGILASASVITSLVKGVASSIPIIGSIVAATLPLIGSLFPNGPQAREAEISKALTQAQYLAPTALNETMSTNGNYVSTNMRGGLTQTGFSARPQVTDPYLYWGPNNTPIVAPGGVTSPYSPQPQQAQPAVVHNHYYDVHALDVGSFHDYLQANHQAVGDAVHSHLAQGHTALIQRIQYQAGR